MRRRHRPARVREPTVLAAPARPHDRPARKHPVLGEQPLHALLAAVPRVDVEDHHATRRPRRHPDPGVGVARPPVPDRRLVGRRVLESVRRQRRLVRPHGEHGEPGPGVAHRRVPRRAHVFSHGVPRWNGRPQTSQRGKNQVPHRGHTEPRVAGAEQSGQRSAERVSSMRDGASATDYPRDYAPLPIRSSDRCDPDSGCRMVMRRILSLTSRETRSPACSMVSPSRGTSRIVTRTFRIPGRLSTRPIRT